MLALVINGSIRAFQKNNSGEGEICVGEGGDERWRRAATAKVDVSECRQLSNTCASRQLARITTQNSDGESPSNRIESNDRIEGKNATHDTRHDSDTLDYSNKESIARRSTIFRCFVLWPLMTCVASRRIASSLQFIGRWPVIGHRAPKYGIRHLLLTTRSSQLSRLGVTSS